MKSSKRSIKPSQPDSAEKRLNLRELHDQLLEAIDRWTREHRFDSFVFPSTLWDGMVHKTSGYVEEIVGRCVDIFVGLASESHAVEMHRHKAKPGLGWLVRDLKKLDPIINKNLLKGPV
jgi:hypothetical protein